MGRVLSDVVLLSITEQVQHNRRRLKPAASAYELPAVCTRRPFT